MPPDFEAKIVLLGSASVGKTCIVCRAVCNEFDAEMPSTYGASYCEKEVEVSGTTISLQIWDAAGAARFRTLAPMYYRGASVVVLVFSVIDKASLNDARAWAEEVQTQSDAIPPFVLVGNKCDLVDERTVEKSASEALASELRATYFEVSAKTGIGIDELFLSVANHALNNLHGSGSLNTEVKRKNGGGSWDGS